MQYRLEKEQYDLLVYQVTCAWNDGPGMLRAMADYMDEHGVKEIGNVSFYEYDGIESCLQIAVNQYHSTKLEDKTIEVEQ